MRSVEMSSPMRRGLTQGTVVGIGLHDHAVEMSSPMRRGLTLISFPPFFFLKCCRNEFPDEKGIDTT